MQMAPDGTRWPIIGFEELEEWTDERYLNWCVDAQFPYGTPPGQDRTLHQSNSRVSRELKLERWLARGECTQVVHEVFCSPSSL